jgi:hypothetical protein
MYQRPLRAIVGCVSVAACASLVGCTHLVEGTSSFHPENTVEHLTLVKNAELPSLVLQAPEVSGVMKADLDAVAIYSNVGPKPGVADQKCAGAVAAGAEPMYRGSGYAAVMGLGMVGEDDRSVDEGVAAFGDAAAAHEFVETRLHQWKDCADRVLTLTPPGWATRALGCPGPHYLLRSRCPAPYPGGDLRVRMLTRVGGPLQHRGRCPRMQPRHTFSQRSGGLDREQDAGHNSAVTAATQTPAPGFKMPCGSNASLMRRLSAMASGPR